MQQSHEVLALLHNGPFIASDGGQSCSGLIRLDSEMHHTQNDEHKTWSPQFVSNQAFAAHLSQPLRGHRLTITLGHVLS